VLSFFLNHPCRLPARLALALLTLGLSSFPLSGQTPIVLQRLAGPIQLDGMSDEPAWESIEPLPAVMRVPNFGDAPSERTEFRLAYDDEYLYASARMYDSDPAGVRATSLRRDVASPSNDYFGIILDSFYDRETSLLFATTPAGVRIDGALAADGRGTVDFDWNTFWDAEVRQTDQGWFAEIRIPFSSLRFQQVGGRVTMAITAWRRIARKNEDVTFPAIPAGAGSVFRASHTHPVELEQVTRRNPIYATPYALAGGGRAHALNTARTGYESSLQQIAEIGLDVKYAVTSNLTLDLTYNTDFAQVEADDQLVNLTRFSLFFPERRLFFQERASAFEFSTGGNDRVFYTRRLGLAGGRPIPVHGGARLVGRIGDWNVGFLNMQTAGFDNLPSENFGVARFTRRVLNDNSYVGGIVTSRVGGGDQDFTVGLDGNVRLRGQDYLTLNWAHSNSDAPTGLLDHSMARARLQRRSTDGFIFDLDASRVGDAYDPVMGFQLRDNYTRLGDQIGYGWRPGRASRLLRHAISMTGYIYRSNGDRAIESARLGPEWHVEMKTGRQFTIGVATLHEHLNRDFRLGPAAVVPRGSYSYWSTALTYRAPGSAMFRPGATLEAGSFFDGSQITARLTPTWFVSRHLELNGTAQHSRIDLPARQQTYRANILGLRARAALNTRLSATGFVQYNDATDAFSGNLRVRYNPREGNDLYLVYNLGANTDRLNYDPHQPLIDSQVLLIKYSRTFDLGR
jgi:hypothetical protein